jgi:hypothetical protein
MKDLLMEIEEMLDAHSKPHNWLSTEEIADQLGVPLSMVGAVVEQRWADRIEGVSL